MTIQPAGELQIIDQRHVRFLQRHQQMIIAAIYLAWTPAAAADSFGCSEPTVLRVRRKTIEDVFDATELEGTPELLRLWGERHRACCTAGTFEMIENSQLLVGW